MSKIAIGNAIGKIILMGEHSVVYGEPAIAIPFPEAKIESEIYKNDGEGVLNCFLYNGSLLKAPEEFDGLKKVIKTVIEDFDENLEALSIDIRSTIPSERGMGSSAAVSTSTVRALYKFFDRDLSQGKLTELVNISEEIVHGNPSGIDTAIVVGEKPLYYIKGKPLEVFDLKLDAYLVVSDTGQKGNTKHAVAKVAKYIDKNQNMGKGMIEVLGRLCKDAKEYIEDGEVEKLGRAMEAAHMTLQQLGVSNKALNRLVSVSIGKGALGAKLTGGGLGGAVITLCESKKSAENVSEGLLENGAENTWIYYMGDEQIES